METHMGWAAENTQSFLIDDQRRLHEYWSELTDGDVLPTRRMLAPLRMKQVLSQLSLIDVEADGGYRMRLVGSALREHWGRETTGLRLEELPYVADVAFWRCVLDRVAADRLPSWGATRARRGLVQVWMRLPLSDDGRTVTAILGLDVIRQADRLPARVRDMAMAA
jgi:hypothetical protein